MIRNQRHPSLRAIALVSGCLTIAAVTLLPRPGHANVTLNPLFGDHMVLQRDRPLPIWGAASPGEHVTVTFHGETGSTTTGAGGKWIVTLPPVPVSNTPETLTVQGNNQLTVSDILVGDIWMGTGQSNMYFPVWLTDGKQRVQQAQPGTYDGIRLFRVAEAAADTPADTVDAHWTVADTPHIVAFSATLFYFAESLHQKMPGVPLGLVESCVGATNSYCWIPNEVRDQDPAATYVRQWYAQAARDYTPDKYTAYQQAKQAYDAQVAQYKAQKQPLPPTIRSPGEPMGPMNERRPSALYNGMIAPLEPFAVRGDIWYQGEWDSRPDWLPGYHDLFVSLAKSWRADWASKANDPKAGDFPIYIVQLPAYNNGNLWPAMREVEANLASDVPNSGYVTTLDTNDGSVLHPPQKTEIGRRLALLALAKAYGQNIAYHGPTLKSANIQGSQMILTFDPGDDSLKSADSQPLRNFELAGADGKYAPAVATIQGDTITVTAPGVTTPATVRYAWAPTPQPMNFVNADGLPAPPFRTDTLSAP